MFKTSGSDSLDERTTRRNFLSSFHVFESGFHGNNCLHSHRATMTLSCHFFVVGKIRAERISDHMH